MMVVLGGLGLAVLTVLLFLALKPAPRRADPAIAEIVPEKQPCPLCGSPLSKGQRIHSVVYASSTPDKIMEISGCLHCRPPSALNRFCPVCKKELRPGEIVTARVFERKGATGSKKTHVHVLGCPRCRN